MEYKVIHSKVFNGKNFSQITIGDPYYFENLDHDAINSLCFQYMDFEKKSLENKICKVCVYEIEETYKPFEIHEKQKDVMTFNTIHLCFFLFDKNSILAKDDFFFDSIMNGLSVNPELIEKKINLGCDTAQFEISVDGDFPLSFYTSCDGSYGKAFKLKNKEGFFVDVKIFNDMISFQEMIQNAKYLFDIDDSLDKRINIYNGEKSKTGILKLKSDIER